MKWEAYQCGEQHNGTWIAIAFSLYTLVSFPDVCLPSFQFEPLNMAEAKATLSAKRKREPPARRSAL